MATSTVLLWFRNDLRITDNRALSAAVESGASIVPVYILDDKAPGTWARGAASRWWLHHSLTSLAKDLKGLGAQLILKHGDTAKELDKLASETGATAVYFTRAYEPCASALETKLKTALEKAGVTAKRYSGSLLKEPEAIRTQGGDVYKVYTPFWRAVMNSGPPAKPLAAPSVLKAAKSKIASDTLADWKLLPTKPDWSQGFVEEWQPGEAGAQARLKAFLASALATYTEERNRPDRVGTSQLSPHLHFGEISPNQCWYGATSAAARANGKADKGLETFQKELVWREFAYTLLVHWPDLPDAPFRKEFSAYPWRTDAANLKAWQRGQTGYPIVDAGMRQLWHTGWMHNRVRMIVASFLIKHLGISWQEGEAWFWDTLVDADLANNAASWQWVAGSGADAAPYFRIFNPVTQGEKFDPEGQYVRRWVPELAKLPNSAIHAPWLEPPAVLKAAGVDLGKSYPLPIVDHGKARERAMAGYEKVKAASAAAR